jgi:hypothetical protein
MNEDGPNGSPYGMLAKHDQSEMKCDIRGSGSMRYTSYLKVVSTLAEEFPGSVLCLSYGLVWGQLELAPAYFMQQEDLLILRHKVWDIVRIFRHHTRQTSLAFGASQWPQSGRIWIRCD